MKNHNPFSRDRGVILLFLLVGTSLFSLSVEGQTQKKTESKTVKPLRTCLFDQLASRGFPERFAGMSADGDGVLQDYLFIESANNLAKVVLEGRDPVAFFSVTNHSAKNPCLKGFGLGVTSATKNNNNAGFNAGFTFTFKPGYSVTWFQLRPLDFGDQNAPEANSTSVWLRGYQETEEKKWAGESVVVRRLQDGEKVKKRYDACDKFKQDSIDPLRVTASPGTSFNKIEVLFNYVKGSQIVSGQTSDSHFALVDVCYELLVPVCPTPKNPQCDCLQSQFWEKRTTLRVINQSPGTVHIYWVSNTKTEIRTVSLKAGSSYKVSTYLTHAFRVRDNCGELLYEHYVNKKNEDVVVTGVFTKPTCSSLCPPPPTSPKPTTVRPTTKKPTTSKPITKKPNTTKPKPTTPKPTTPKPTTPKPTTAKPTPAPTPAPTTLPPTPPIIPMDPVAPIDCIPIGSPKPEIIELVTVARDLRQSHPDMKQTYRFEKGIVESLIGSDGKPVYNSSRQSVTTTGANAFSSWFNTGPTNEEHNLAIPLRLLPGTNLYVFGSSTFFPLDNHLLGNEGDDHNYFWTIEAHAQFTYKGGETFKFTGNDDAWVFINGVLVIDLGGIHGSMVRQIDLDNLASALNLKKGYSYPFALFFANRKKSTSDFHIETSIVLKKDCTYIRRDKTLKAPLA